jgi:hypothetical protein
VNTTHYPNTGATICGGVVTPADTHDSPAPLPGSTPIGQPLVAHAPPAELATAAHLQEHVMHLQSALNDLTTRLGAVTTDRDHWKNRAEEAEKRLAERPTHKTKG